MIIRREHIHIQHNAFIDLNEAGQYYIFCSSESKTYWQDSREIDAAKSKLFWNESVGGPSMIDYVSYNGDGPFTYSRMQLILIITVYRKILIRIFDLIYQGREIIFNPGLSGGLNDEYYNLFEETEFMKKDYSTLPTLALESSC